MDLPPQPPPDAPAPPPGPQAMRSQMTMNWIIVVGILSVIGVLVIAVTPRVIRSPKVADRAEATNNIRQLHLALFDFETHYGKFPDASTIAAVKADTGTAVTLGSSSSNEVLRQLLVTVAKCESVFWAKSTISPRKPDNDMSGNHALEKGECAFAYVAGLSSSSDGSTPILMAPMDPAKRSFERKGNYKNMAVIAFIDGSVRFFPVDRHGRVQLNGMDFFDPRQPFWKGKAPDIKWPE